MRKYNYATDYKHHPRLDRRWFDDYQPTPNLLRRDKPSTWRVLKNIIRNMLRNL